MSYQKVFKYENIPKALRSIQYECIGPIIAKAESYQMNLDAGKQLPFNKIIQLQDGNPQQLGQPPISFMRQVMACVLDTGLMEQQVYHQDVVNRAKTYFNSFPSIGVYPDTQGYFDIRDNVAKFIAKRDGGIPCDPNLLYNTAGSIHAISSIVEFAIKDKFKDGVMLPMPSHPLLTATINCFGGIAIGYYLDESKNWELSIKDLETQYQKSTKEGTNVKAIIIINPNNPTGQILSESNIKEIIQFCHSHSIVILADEIYQQNIYDPNQKFVSFKKVLVEMGTPFDKDVQLVSINSISKGYYGECGLRGGYMELINVEQGIFDNLWKLDGMYTSANSAGQVALDLMVNPPSKESNCSQETIDQYNKEIQQIHSSLANRAKIVTDYLKQCKNITTAEINGSMYAFPQIQFSENAKKAAEKEGVPVDTFYCFLCLDDTGIVLQSGSEFGQLPGTYHIRISILEYDPVQMEETMKRFKKFNDEFHVKFL